MFSGMLAAEEAAKALNPFPPLPLNIKPANLKPVKTATLATPNPATPLVLESYEKHFKRSDAWKELMQASETRFKAQGLKFKAYPALNLGFRVCGAFMVQNSGSILPVRNWAMEPQACFSRSEA